MSYMFKDGYGDDQAKFMVAGQQTVTLHNSDQADLYVRLVKEEYKEFIDAVNFEDEENELKEAADLLVVVLGFIISKGVNPDDVWRLVFNNNMAKVSDKVLKDKNGKIQKSPESKLRKKRMMDELRGLLAR